MSQQERVTRALCDTGFTRTETASVPALRGNRGTVLRAGYTQETWEAGDLSITVSFTPRGEFKRYSYSGNNTPRSVNRNGGAEARMKATRHAGVFTYAELTELFMRNLDEMVTGCRYHCRVTDDRQVEWVREA